MSGIEAVKEIRKLEGYLTTPIVAMTAYAMQKDKEQSTFWKINYPIHSSVVGICLILPFGLLYFGIVTCPEVSIIKDSVVNSSKFGSLSSTGEAFIMDAGSSNRGRIFNVGMEWFLDKSFIFTSFCLSQA